MFAAVTLSLPIDAVLGFLLGSGGSCPSTTTTTTPTPFKNGGIEPNADPWTLSACPLFMSLWALKTEELKVTPGRLLSAHTHNRLFGMHSQRVNRVTSSAPCSVLKLSTPRTLCYISGHLHDIKCPLPMWTAHTETMTLVCFAVAMKVAWRWFLRPASQSWLA